ncbi:immunity protein YezG family protein [Cohnella panacarvi]|uniref:immunity protein YezG family protein n=1 Tax=Cohnella panacarvi TaxID=400776 RepID=UPI0004788EAC|nr:immunity protein YezG family protein [Cohnella panacarvi]
MDENKLGNLYQKIVQTVIETIPEEWSKVYLYGEITEDVGNTYFYYYPVNNDLPVQSHSIPKIYEVEEEEYERLWEQLLHNLEELWHEFKSNDREPWTNLTMIFNREGNFKIDYDYEDLTDANDHERVIIWKHKYLNLWPSGEDDKKFLEEYLKSNNEM